MPPKEFMREELPEDFPIPPEQVFYAHLADNRQKQNMPVLINYVHYPTLGCPALLGPGEKLQVLLSLPASVDIEQARFSVQDRHRQVGATYNVERIGKAETNPDWQRDDRKLYRIWLNVNPLPHALYDLTFSLENLTETQFNAVRTYEFVTGLEKVVFCGDSQFHMENKVCLNKFVSKVNEHDIAWIALIGDICDNSIKSKLNLIALAAKAGNGKIVQYYDKEYQQSHEKLRELRHPIVLVPGNHDGMAAYKGYKRGVESNAYLEDEPENVVEYDGLYHFRTTFGPLYHSFEWGGTKYLCTNTFELTRQQRLGFHGIVANWGGWMREKQRAWVKHQLEGATGKKVMLMHHDPRGGCEGDNLGRYHKMRAYHFDSKWKILKSYLSYVGEVARVGWQQEWMAPENGKLADHPVKNLLADMLTNEVWAVVMGHDNENWVNSYFDENSEMFKTDPTEIEFASRAEVGDDDLVDDIRDYLESGKLDELHQLLSEEKPSRAEAGLNAALREIANDEMAAEVVYAANPVEKWGLKLKSAIHFVHVDDIGAYKHEEGDFGDYGYVVARLDDGAPVEVQGHRITGHTGAKIKLEED